MSDRRFTRAALVLLASTSLVPAAFGQTLPPPRATFDGNGVDLATGTYNISAVGVSVGGDLGLAWGQGYDDILTASISKGTNTAGQTELVVVIGKQRDAFILSGTTYTAKVPSGSSLSLSGLVYTYRDGTGAVATFSKVDTSTTIPIGAGNEGLLLTLTLPNQKVLNYQYQSVKLAVSSSPGGTIYRTFMRLQSVTDNLGQQLHLTYQLDSMTATTQYAQWSNRTRLTALDTNVDPCSASVNTCTTTVTWPKIDFGTSGQLTDALSRTTTVTTSSTTTSIRLPGSTADDVTVSYGSDGKVSSVVSGGVTTSYLYYDDTANDQRRTTVMRMTSVARPSQGVRSSRTSTGSSYQRFRSRAMQMKRGSRRPIPTTPITHWTRLRTRGWTI